MSDQLLLATTPQFVGRGRRCGIWISPWVGDPVILDTRALQGDALRFAGPDTFPEDCVLVIVNPAEHQRLTDAAARLPYPVGGSLVAMRFIDAACVRDPTLAPRIGWHL